MISAIMADKINEKKGRKEKRIGQVFTPNYIVNAILSYCDYMGPSILGKHIIDNSCGNGAFLVNIVQRYIDEADAVGLGKHELSRHLSTFVHGIDIDAQAYKACLDNLNRLAAAHGLEGIQWDIYNEDALTCKKFDGKMDYVVGNPPYVRVHHLAQSYDEVKKYTFAHGGMTDLYLAFFELGFKMLSPNGELCYITPSSWLTSIAASNMRRFILKQKNLVELVDLEHFQAFENVTAYTMISHFKKSKGEGSFNYYTFDKDFTAAFLSNGYS